MILKRHKVTFFFPTMFSTSPIRILFLKFLTTIISASLLFSLKKNPLFHQRLFLLILTAGNSSCTRFQVLTPRNQVRSSILLPSEIRSKPILNCSFCISITTHFPLCYLKIIHDFFLEYLHQTPFHVHPNDPFISTSFASLLITSRTMQKFQSPSASCLDISIS